MSQPSNAECTNCTTATADVDRNVSHENTSELEAHLATEIKAGSSMGPGCAPRKRKMKRSIRRMGSQPKPRKRKSRLAKKSCGVKRQAPRRKAKKTC